MWICDREVLKINKQFYSVIFNPTVLYYRTDCMFYTSALWSNFTCSVENLEIKEYLNEIFKKILILTKSGLPQKQSNSSSKVLRQRKSISE
jgi:hypothetical protein